jgi:predicted acetyltransferase
MSVEVQVLPIAEQELSVLRQLFDFHVYDFSELMGLDVEHDGRFKLPDLAAYWTDPWRHPFFIRVDAKLAGFALVHERSRLTGADGINDIAEFFVMRRYRRQGVGELAAGEIFKRFAGSWEVRQRHANVGAIAFWRRVIGRYTAGRFREVIWADDVWQGPVQLFTT